MNDAILDERPTFAVAGATRLAFWRHALRLAERILGLQEPLVKGNKIFKAAEACRPTKRERASEIVTDVLVYEPCHSGAGWVLTCGARNIANPKIVLERGHAIQKID